MIVDLAIRETTALAKYKMVTALFIYRYMMHVHMLTNVVPNVKHPNFKSTFCKQSLQCSIFIKLGDALNTDSLKRCKIV